MGLRFSLATQALSLALKLKSEGDHLRAAGRQAEQLIDALWSVVHEVATALIYLAGFVAR